MTTKDIARSLSPAVESTWTGPVPSRVTSISAAITRWEWDVDLTAPQATAFDDAVLAVKGGMDPVLYASVKTDLVTLRAYVNIASPTLVQTAALGKALVRVLRVLLRD